MKKTEITEEKTDVFVKNSNFSIKSSDEIGWIKWNATVDFDTREEICKIVKEEVDKNFGWTIEELRKNLFTLFSILASVIAFLFAEIQILKSLCSRQSIIWFTLILLWSLSVFVILIKMLLNKDDTFEWKYICKKKSGILLILSILFIFFWIILSSWWHEIKCENEAIIKQYQENLYEELDYKIEKKIKKEINNIFSR